MIANQSHQFTCLDFVLDIASHRVEWITVSDLESVAITAGYKTDQVRSSLRKGVRNRLLSQMVRNIELGTQPGPRFVGMFTAENSKKPRPVMVRHLPQHGLAVPTTVVGLGPLAAGLLGRSVAPWPDADRMFAALRLTSAFLRFVRASTNLHDWKLLRSVELGSRVAMASQCDDNGKLKKLIFAPVRTGRRKQFSLLKALHRAEVAYEIW